MSLLLDFVYVVIIFECFVKVLVILSFVFVDIGEGSLLELKNFILEIFLFGCYGCDFFKFVLKKIMRLFVYGVI